MLDSSAKYTNAAFLEARDVLVSAGVEIQSITLLEFLTYLNENYPHAMNVPLYLTPIDINGGHTTLDAYKLKQLLSDDFNVDTSFTRSFNYTHTFDVSKDKIFECGYTDYVSPGDIFWAVYGTTTTIVQLDVETNLYEVVTGEWYAIADPIEYSEFNELKLEKFEKNNNDEWESTGEFYFYRIPEDGRVIYLLQYMYRNDTEYCDEYFNVNPDDWFIETIVVYRNEFRPEVTNDEVMILPIRNNSSFVENPSYQKVLLNTMGFKEDDLIEALDDPDIVAAILSYTSDRNSEVESIAKSVENLYGTLDVPNDVSLSTDYYTIEYAEITTYKDNGFGETIVTYTYSLTFNGHRFNLNADTTLYMVPVKDFSKLPLKERYEFIQKTFALIGNTEVTVDIAWYQTGFFRMVIVVAALASAIFTGGASLPLMLAGTVISKIAYNMWGTEGALIAGAVFAIITAGMSISGSAMSIAEISLMTVNLGAQLLVAYTKYSANMIAEETQQYIEETEEYEEELHEMQKEILYMPLEQYDMYYNNVNSMVYSIYDESNYDMLGQLNKRMGVLL
jgi:hypothetical protein